MEYSNNYSEEILTVLDAVRNVNSLLFVEDKEDNLVLEDGTTYPLELNVITNDHYIKVKYIGITVWFSLEDERKYDEEKDCYESLFGFLKSKINAINKALGKIYI